jgi:hypothetical protein
MNIRARVVLSVVSCTKCASCKDPLRQRSLLTSQRSASRARRATRAGRGGRLPVRCGRRHRRRRRRPPGRCAWTAGRPAGSRPGRWPGARRTGPSADTSRAKGGVLARSNGIGVATWRCTSNAAVELAGRPMPYEESYEAHVATEQVRVVTRGTVGERRPATRRRSRRSSTGLVIEGPGRPGNRAEDSCGNDDGENPFRPRMQGAERSVFRRDAPTGRWRLSPRRFTNGNHRPAAGNVTRTVQILHVCAHFNRSAMAGGRLWS